VSSGCGRSTRRDSWEKSNRGAWLTIIKQGDRSREPEVRSKPASLGGSCAAVVSRELQRYAARGVFRAFSRTGDEFHFHWLWDLPFHLTFDRKAGVLAFKKLLPNIPAGSALEASLKEFLKGFGSSERPAHRRIDPERVSVRYANRRGTITLSFVISGDNHEYAVRKVLQLVNEVFLGFLHLHYPEYMAENFRLPLE
jgi:hypothetical protein